MFLDHPSAIFEHSTDGLTLNILLCPRHKYFLTVSLSSLNLWSAEDSLRTFITSYTLTQNYIDQYGLFNQAAWINGDVFAALTMPGNVLFFQIHNENTEIRLISVAASDSKSIFTSISSFANYLVASTNNGEIVIIAPNSKSHIQHKVIDDHIKSISIIGNHGTLLAGNRLAYRFTINKTVLVEKNYDLGLQKIDIKSAITISQSPNRLFTAILNPAGFIYVTNFTDYTNSFKIPSQLSVIFLWSQDGNTLIAIFRDGTVYIISMLLRVPRRMKIPELEGCNAAALGRGHIFASTAAGLVNIPILTSPRSGYPLIFGPNTLYAFRCVDRKAFSVNFVLPTPIENTIKQIDYAAADNIERFVAFSGRGQIFLLDQVLGKWISPQTPKINCRGLCWSGRLLCCLSFNSETLQYSLNVFEIHMYEFLSLIFTFSLPSRPISITADEKLITIILTNKVLMFKDLKCIGSMSFPSQPINVQPNHQNSAIFVQLLDRKLQMIDLNTMQTPVVHDDCGDFIVDSGFGIIFVQTGLRIKLSSIKNIKFGPFIETSDITVGVFPRCTSILMLQSTAKPPFTPNLNQFFDLSIVRELKDPANAAAIVKQRLHPGYLFTAALRQISVFSLRDRLGNLLVPFLEYFPEERNTALASALRAVESPERKGVFQVLGHVSSIFVEMANAEMMQTDEYITFVDKEGDGKRDIENAALLLPVVMEEDGPLIGFPAAIYSLTKLHTRIDFVESLVRFLDPLLSGGKPIGNGMVDCVGMQLTVAQYKNLYNRTINAFEFCLVDLMKKILPNIALQFINATKIDAIEIFKKNIAEDDAFNIATILDTVGPLITSGEFERSDATKFSSLTLNGGWMCWTCALLLLTSRSSDAILILNRTPKLKKQILNSQWKHLIEM
ncbi:hypothetical protein TVAG_298280 [Trichomonas vaginalis G3]|uniref:Uncharacterized protein n=1 Tax=Trichomonas vaginalis (strain ATCC PRA-98 / G3) TaxID=412133 RepID=A2ET19_TRIV3|nr:quinoprotein alcohol dehydrogenase-like family [Trichomonas vaginalis G3]EAY04208.1 hypothetical protein TVAG_298280 [Trichomonas vaginalis G3]KAI5493082.1 quinoprotein alcohol dehydrogenase-like family [Trichomonas vaginalis G3]|eukprot:XP_001316431.1 hypothetical protein [Trichomonas vaginalis G3]